MILDVKPAFLVCPVKRKFNSACIFCHVCHTEVFEDTVKPGIELLIFLETTKVPPYSHETLLREIQSVFPVPNKSLRQRIRSFMITGYKFIECTNILCPSLSYQIIICWMCGSQNNPFYLYTFFRRFYSLPAGFSFRFLSIIEARSEPNWLMVKSVTITR